MKKINAMCHCARTDGFHRVDSNYTKHTVDRCYYEKPNPISDLLDMIQNFPNPDIKEILKTGYTRGFNDGIKETKESIKKLL